MADFAKCAKRSRRKKRRKNPKLWPLVSRKWLERFSSNLECGLPYLAGTSVATLVSIGYGSTEIQRCENRVYFLPVNVLTVWRAGFLGRTTHYRVSYIYIYLLMYKLNHEYIRTYVVSYLFTNLYNC